jgi:hypothetical protein
LGFGQQGITKAGGIAGKIYQSIDLIKSLQANALPQHDRAPDATACVASGRLAINIEARLRDHRAPG